MTKASPSSPSTRAETSPGIALAGRGVGRVGRRTEKAGAAPIDTVKFEAVMRAAELSGLLTEKSGRIGVRVSPSLVAQAKRRTGLKTDTDLVEFALAAVALEDNFAEAFKASRGKVDPKVKLGF